ncbi:uncharacterized protein LOC124924077 [Impatiens glandulifera]|uniref:uncharacterized protein LOC124924077 n=1 Tax=Impatiens glandulifera TaxID=253017 RepID=UPI001FB0F5F3|nr:uncharacterized protein LOC124924077 [Impatiens glandulifera]
MGSLSYLFDFNQDSSSTTRKVQPQQRKHVDGLEAPRNSLELQGEAFQTSYNSNNTYVGGALSAYEWLENTSFPTETSMRKSISNETTIKRPNSNNNNNNARRTTPSVVARLMGMEMLPSSDNYRPLPPPPVNKPPPPERKEVEQSITNFRKSEEDSLHVNCNPLDFGKSKKANHRPEHPQEEELQKFKKDFEAWQAARFKECTKLVESSSGRNSEQLIAQENLNREKIALYSGSRIRNSISNEEDQMPNKPASSSPLGSYYSSRTRSRTVSYDSTDFETSSSDHRLGKSSGPTKIVILRPGPDQFVDSEESWVGCSSANSEERVGGASNNNNNNSIEDFLKEVKERLKCELQGKYQKRVRGRGIETPFSEKQQPVDAKQIAQNIAKQVRESVMIRSADSPDFIINRDTRKIVADKLRNVLDSNIEPSSSPRNLTRSMSAPVSTTSFGKLLLEDRHVLTGAHIRRKHESSSSVDSNILKRKKEKFTNIKERVSSFKYRFTLHGWLFRRRFHSSEDVFKYDYGCSRNDIMSGPTVVNSNYGNVHENSTEVPPSPASVCSSSHEEWGRAADYLTPSSPFSELSPLRDSSLPQVFREINCNLSELRRQLNALDTNGASMEEEEEQQQQLTEEADTMELDDPAEAYIRDLLIASGLYDCTFNKQPLSRWEPMAKPINNRVFEEVKMYGEDESSSNRRLLFDLTNEALPVILGQPVMKFPPSGSKLLNSVLEMIRGYLSPPPDRFYFSIDGMVGRDLGCAPWTILVKDEVNAMGKEVESMITSGLIEEIVKELHLLQLHRLRRIRHKQMVISSASSVCSSSSSS